MSKDTTDKIMLEFQSLVSIIETTHTELFKLCNKHRVTSGRDFRRKMRNIAQHAKKASKLSQELETDLREVKKQKKEQS
jgi:hypothetical protein